MKKLKKYLVTRKLIVSDSCFVAATSKKQAIEMAKDSNFFHEYEEEQIGSPEKDYDYKAKVEED